MAIDGFLSNLKANIAGNYARAYLFYVKIPDSPVTIPDNQKFLVRSTNLPESTIEAITVPYQGMEFKLGSTHTYAEWECTFNADNSMILRKAFVDWMTTVHNPRTNAHGMPTDYFGTVEIELLDPFQDFSGAGEANANYVASLYNAWPSNVGPLDLAYDNKDIGQFSVTFTYNWHDEEQA